MNPSSKSNEMNLIMEPLSSVEEDEGVKQPKS